MTAPSILLPRRTARDRATFTLSARQQRIFAVILLLHGLAHAGFGIWAGEAGLWWLPISLWELAMVGFIAAAFGAMGVSGLGQFWRPLTIIAAASSLLLLIVIPGFLLVVGLTGDFVALSVVAYSSRPASEQRPPALHHGMLRLTGVIISWMFLSYVGMVLALRPWNVRWGTTASERATTLPGDEFVPVAHYRIDHAITIDAPPESVWPWVIQIGQDRAGFYSYTKLENAVGARITNGDQIVPAWQKRQVGELVPTVPENYLGGVFGGRLGCKVLKVVPGTALVLEGWGAFVVMPASDNKTRMLVRTRAEGVPNITAIIEAPFRLLVYEPAHFIMERGMLLGIKQRAEASRLESTFIASAAPGNRQR